MDAVWIRVIAAAVIAYFCGCFNGAVIVSKYILQIGRASCRERVCQYV